MDSDMLNNKIIEKGLSIPKVAAHIGIGKKAMYEKMRGKTQFKQREIVDLRNLLDLSDAEILDIFFAKKVS